MYLNPRNERYIGEMRDSMNPRKGIFLIVFTEIETIKNNVDAVRHISINDIIRSLL